MECHAIALENEVPSPLFLESETTLDDFIASWRRGKLPKQAWTHAAHLATAAYFAFDHAPEALFYAMKAGILHHNHCVGTPNTDTGGYHETLTRFWCAQIGELVRSGRFSSRLEAARSAVDRFALKRDAYRAFYSFDVVNDRRARREWVAPDCFPASA